RSGSSAPNFHVRGWSAYPPILSVNADMLVGQPSAKTGCEQSQQKPLFDDLVGGHLHDQRHREAEGLRRFELDDEFDLGRLHHRKLGGVLTLEDAIDIEGR